MRYKIFVNTENGISKVYLPANFKKDFIERFGLMEIPNENEFNTWLVSMETKTMLPEINN